MKRRLILSLLMLSMAGSSATAYSVDIDASKQKLDQASEEKKELEEKLNKKEGEVDGLIKEIEEIDSQMRAASDELEKAQSELSKIEAEVVAVKKELEAAETKLKEKQEMFNSRVSVMYKNSSAGYLEVVLGSTDVVDLFNRISMIKDIVGYDAEIIAEVKSQKEIITVKGEELKAKESEAKEATRIAETKRAELESISNSKIAYMETLKNDEMAFRSSIARLEAESEKILEDIRAEENRKAEEARKAAEAASKPQTPSSGSSGSSSSGSSNSGGSNSTATPSQPVSSSGMIRPVASGPVTSEFGPRWGTVHRGIDIGIPTGTPILASADGVVARSYYSSSYGEVVFINHGGGIVTVYAHNSRRLVSEGQRVSKGQVIAYSGNTGDSTGPHLHFEVVVNGAKVNPRNYINF